VNSGRVLESAVFYVNQTPFQLTISCAASATTGGLVCVGELLLRVALRSQAGSEFS